MDKDTLTKQLEFGKKIAAKTAENVKAEADGTSPEQSLDVKDEKKPEPPSQEDLMKAYAKEKMGIDFDAFLEGIKNSN